MNFEVFKFLSVTPGNAVRTPWQLSLMHVLLPSNWSTWASSAYWIEFRWPSWGPHNLRPINALKVSEMVLTNNGTCVLLELKRNAPKHNRDNTRCQQLNRFYWCSSVENWTASGSRQFSSSSSFSDNFLSSIQGSTSTRSTQTEPPCNVKTPWSPSGKATRGYWFARSSWAEESILRSCLKVLAMEEVLCCFSDLFATSRKI